ncbi:hypothetical protein HRH25_10330 [Flavisolibacter sp. BT320]|nr:hypothetical protein [Flavisolibacter longurius]
MISEKQHHFMKLVQIADAKININELFELSLKTTDEFRKFDDFLNTYWQLERMEYLYTNETDAICFKHPRGYQYWQEVLKTQKQEKMKKLYEYWQLWLAIVTVILAALGLLL